MSAFLGDRAFTRESASLPVLSPETGIELSEGLIAQLGLPEEQLMEPRTDTITYEYFDTNAKTKDEYIGERIVLFNREVAGYRVEASRAFFQFSKEGELVHMSVRWPPFKKKEIVGEAKSKATIASEMAVGLMDLFHGKEHFFATGPELKWIPEGLGEDLTYKLSVVVSITLAHPESDDSIGEIVVDVY